LNWSNFTSGMAAAVATLSLLSLTGCSQLSSSVRRDHAEVERKAPVPPDFNEPRPELKPVPQQNAELPDLQELPEIPPAAPPSESAHRGIERIDDGEFADENSVAEGNAESEEFFERPSRHIVLERGRATAARFAELGKEAEQRKTEQVIPWPVIIPANVRPLQLTDGPALLPVP